MYVQWSKMVRDMAWHMQYCVLAVVSSGVYGLCPNEDKL